MVGRSADTVNEEIEMMPTNNGENNLSHGASANRIPNITETSSPGYTTTHDTQWWQVIIIFYFVILKQDAMIRFSKPVITSFH